MKTTLHRHGLSIGWDGIFFLYGDNEVIERSNYHAVVEVQGYVFDQINMVNVSLMTPAQQIVWHQLDFETHTLTGYARQWLEDNVGERGPQWYARATTKNQIWMEGILFRRRKDALAFVKWIQGQLAGMRIGI